LQDIGKYTGWEDLWWTIFQPIETNEHASILICTSSAAEVFDRCLNDVTTLQATTHTSVSQSVAHSENALD